MTTATKPAAPLLTVKWLPNSVCLTHPELGAVRVVRDSGSAHYLEEIAAKHNAYPQLVEALRRAQPWVERTSNGKPMVSNAQIEFADEIRALLRSLGEEV